MVWLLEGPMPYLYNSLKVCIFSPVADKNDVDHYQVRVICYQLLVIRYQLLARDVNPL
jgi:hypothetical protein